MVSVILVLSLAYLFGQVSPAPSFLRSFFLLFGDYSDLPGFPMEPPLYDAADDILILIETPVIECQCPGLLGYLFPSLICCPASYTHPDVHSVSLRKADSPDTIGEGETPAERDEPVPESLDSTSPVGECEAYDPSPLYCSCWEQCPTEDRYVGTNPTISSDSSSPSSDSSSSSSDSSSSSSDSSSSSSESSSSSSESSSSSSDSSSSSSDSSSSTSESSSSSSERSGSIPRGGEDSMTRTIQEIYDSGEIGDDEIKIARSLMDIEAKRGFYPFQMPVVNDNDILSKTAPGRKGKHHYHD